MMTVGEKIKELRLEKNLSQAQFATLIGVSQKAIDYWERNINEPKIGYIINLVKVCDITYNEFFEDLQ